MSISLMDVMAGALKFLVGMFWYRSSVPSEFFFPMACDIWAVLCLWVRWHVTEREQKTGGALIASIIAKQSPARLREGDVQLWFYIAAAAATDWSRIDAARPTSVTPKITNGEFVLGSTPQYA